MFPDPNAAAPQDWQDPYAQPPRPLTPGVPPAGFPGASSAGGFQPGQDSSYGDWWRTPLPDAAFNPQLTGSGAAGMGNTNQPEADTGTTGPSAAAGRLMTGGDKMPPPPAGAAQYAPQGPQGPPPVPQPMANPAADAPSAPRSQTQQAINRDTAAIAQPAPIPGNHWYQRLGMAVLAGTKLAPYAQQIVHPLYSEQMAARGAAEKELQGLSTAQEAQQRGQYYEGLESGRQEERRISAESREGVADTQATQREADRVQKAFNTLVGNRNPIYRQIGQPGPQGWESVPMQNPALPGYTAYVPSQIATVPEELVPFLPGHKAGDPINLEDLKDATKHYQDQLEKQNTAKDAKPDMYADFKADYLSRNPKATAAQLQTAYEAIHQTPKTPPDHGQNIFDAQGRMIRLEPGQTAPPGSQTAQGLNAVNTPTMTQRTAAGRASTVLEMAPEVLKRIDTMGPQLGPVMGRWDQFMQGKAGMDNPDFAALRSDLLMMSSAVALAHAQGRLPENLRLEFDHAINAPNQTPANLKATITTMLPWLKAMQDQGHNLGGGGGTGGGLAVEQWIRDSNGKLVKK